MKNTRVTSAFNYITLLATISISGCSSIQEVHKIERPDLYDQFYAGLTKEGSGYRFSNISFSAPSQNDEDPAVVDINKARPLWSTTEIAKCVDGVGIYYSFCSDEKFSSRFYESAFDPATQLIMTVLSPLNLGLPLFNIYKTTKFSQEKYQQAYKDALARDLEFLHRISDTREKLHVERESYLNTQVELMNRASQKIIVNVIDNSGLYSNYSNPKYLAHLSPQPLDMIDIPELSGNSASQLYEKINQEYKRAATTWSQQSKKILVRCRELPDDLSYSVNCPEYLTAGNEGDLKGEVTYKINSRSYENVFVSNFHLEDETLSLDFNGQSLGVKNKSKGYITIDSISVYYNQNIAEKSHLGIEMSPQSYTSAANRLDINDFQIIWENVNFPELTRKKAASIFLDYGFSVRYRTSDINIEKTLYQTQKFRLLDLITNS